MKNIIEAERLVKNYRQVQAVKDISFSVEQGAFFGFLGVNGAGKSTTINILCSVLEKTSGKVLIGGYDIDKQREQAKKLVGIVFQNSVLDKQLTVKENLISRASYYGMKSRDASERIAELSKIFELEEIMKRRYEKLSGGQRRRVDIARGLINRPEILFLDEPSTGLDPQTRQRVWSIIHKLRHDTGLTVFLTTHYMEETADCNDIIILDNGRIAAHDTPNNLKVKYAPNSLVWYTQNNAESYSLLKKEKIEFEYSAGAYRLKLNSIDDATRLIRKYDEISDYEVIKGNMDNVFLNVTGKRAGD